MISGCFYTLVICVEMQVKAAHASPVCADIRLSPIYSFLPRNCVGGLSIL